MPGDESALDIISRLYAEAARAHGDDPLRIASAVAMKVEALAPDDRLAVRAAFERMASFSAPDRSAADTRH